MARIQELKIFIALCFLGTAFVSLLSASLPNGCLASIFQEDRILMADLTELSLEDLMNDDTLSSEIERSVYGKPTWRF